MTDAGGGSGRVAVVTGAASGMGLGIARDLAGRGHGVALFDLDGDAAEAVAADLRATGAQAVAATVDVADAAAVDAATARVREELGPVGIVVANAGYAPFTKTTEISADLWARVLAVNLTGTFTCVQAALPDMLAARWGRIVTVSSLAGQNGSPRQAHYSAAKGGVIALTKALSWEYARRGITANSIAPGPIDTPMSRAAQAGGDTAGGAAIEGIVPAGRMGRVEEIVAACAYLCSEAAGFVTGQVLGVNGGLHPSG